MEGVKLKKNGGKFNKQHLPRLSTLGSNFLEEGQNKRHRDGWCDKQIKRT